MSLFTDDEAGTNEELSKGLVILHPEIPENSTSILKIKAFNFESAGVGVGVSKRTFEEFKGKWLGFYKDTWCYGLKSGAISSGGVAKKDYGWRIGDRETVDIKVDRKEGTISFAAGGKSFGVVFKDEAIKEGPLYFCVTFYGPDQNVNIVRELSEGSKKDKGGREMDDYEYNDYPFEGGERETPV